jgi:cytochrome c553
MRIWTGALLLMVSAGPALAGAAADAAKCQACHGVRGPSMAPVLNGQRADYILLRLKEFHDPASQSPHATYFMWDMASSIGAAQAKALAAYFAALPPPGPRLNMVHAVTGDTFYHGEGGCSACHGDKGEGGKDAAPRLMGQNPDYLQRQLENFSLSVRYQPAMVHHSLRLTPQQIEALVAYLGGG